MDILERQIPIMEFLVWFRDIVLQEASRIDPIEEASLLLPSDQPEKIHIQDWQWSLRYPYLPPKVDNLNSCADIIQIRLDEARDQLFGLRECPRTFQIYMKQYEFSDPEHVKDKSGKPWLGPSSVTTRDKTRDKSATEAIAAVFQDARMWDIVSHRINDVQQHSKHTEEWSQAMRSLKVFLQDTMLLRLLHQLRFRILTSPGVGNFVHRITSRTKKGELGHRVAFRKDKLAKLLDDKFVWTLLQLVTEADGLKGLDSVALIIELWRLVETGQVQVVRVSTVVQRIIADLALVAEPWVHCNRFAPLVFNHMSDIDYWKQSCAKRADIEKESAIHKDFNALSDPDNNEV